MLPLRRLGATIWPHGGTAHQDRLRSKLHSARLFKSIYRFNVVVLPLWVRCSDKVGIVLRIKNVLVKIVAHKIYLSLFKDSLVTYFGTPTTDEHNSNTPTFAHHRRRCFGRGIICKTIYTPVDRLTDRSTTLWAHTHYSHLYKASLGQPRFYTIITTQSVLCLPQI